MDESRAKNEGKKDRESRLQQAIAADDVAAVHILIVEERELLDRVSKHPFPNTPLHLAAASGKTQVAMEMAILKPSFARKLNPEGYSPMHLALQCKHYHTVRALMTFDPKLIRVRGRCGITPLHYVAGEVGDNELELLAEFLCACKSSIEDLTSRCETAVHVAVKKNNVKAFEVLFGWLKRVYLTEILHWKDEDGNNVLDIAKSKELTEISNLLTGYRRITEWLIGYVKLTAKDFPDKTVRGINEWNPRGDQDVEESQPPTLNHPLSQFLRRELTLYEKCAIGFNPRNESARNIILIVATLITTATYQAALTPPGGYWGDNSSKPAANPTVVTANSSGIAVEKPHQAGNIIMNSKYLHEFTALNSMIFLASILTIWITAIPLFPHTLPVYLLIWFLSIAYFTTATIGFPKSDEVAGNLLVVFYTCLLAAGLVVPKISWMKYVGYRLRLRRDATGRRVGNFLGLKDG